MDQTNVGAAVLRARLFGLAVEEVAEVAGLLPALARVGAARGVRMVGRERVEEGRDLKVKNGRKNVKSAPYWPI